MNTQKNKRATDGNRTPSGEQAHLLQAIWDHSLDAILLTAPDGRIFAANPAACSLFDRTEAELCRLGRDGLLDLSDPNLAAALAERERTGQARREMTLLHPDGSRFVGELTSAAFTDDTGQLRTSMIIRDITGRNHAETELREREAQYRSLFENSIMGISQALPDGRLLRINQAYAEMYGYANPAEMLAAVTDVGQGLYAHPDDRKAVRRILSEQGVMAPREFPLVRRDGSRFVALVSAREIRDATGQLLFYQAEHVDITARKQAEKVLKESETRYRSLFDNMVEGFAYCRMLFEDGQPKDFIYLEVNSTFEKLTGLKDVAGRKASEVIPGICESDPELLDRYGRVALTGQPERFEICVVALKMWLSISVYCPAPEHFVAVFDVITERKQAETKLAASQTALRALAARLQAAREETQQRIARRIHDDLGHAFTDLKLDLAWLDRRLAERKLTKRAAPRQKIATMIQRVEADLDTTRTLSTELRPAVLDTLGLAAALEWAAQQFENRTRIPCTLDLPAEPPPLAADRAAALFRAFQEILTNVARHAGATAVRVRLAATAEQVTLEVSDNGRGITAQQRDDSHALGLLGLRERALEFGGGMEINGAAGKGTTICIRLPLGTP